MAQISSRPVFSTEEAVRAVGAQPDSVGGKSQVRHLHHTALDALEVVSGTGNQDKEEEITHRVDGRLGLSHAHCLDEDHIVAGGLAQQDGLAGLAGHTAEGSGGGTGADEGHGVVAEGLHAGLVAQDAALGLLAAGVDGQDGETMALGCDQIAEGLDEGTLAGSGHARYADTHRLLALGVLQAADYQLVSHVAVLWQGALHEGYGLAENYGVALEYTFHIVFHRHGGTPAADYVAEIWIHDRRLLYPVVHHQCRVIVMILVEKVALSV